MTTNTTTVAPPAKAKKPAYLTKMTTTLEFIDPKMAVTTLQKHNPNNRRVDRGNVAKLASQMEAGQWMPGVAIIKFDPQGNLVDGQHTLYAIEKSNIGQWITVMRGVPSLALNVINTGKPLTLTDHPEIKSLPNRHAISTLILFIYKHQSGLVGQQLFGGMTNYSASVSGSFSELLKTFRNHKTDIVKYAALGSKVSRAIPVTASTVAEAAYLFYSIDEADADDFFAKLESGAGLATDDPIFVLRERIIRDLSNKNSIKMPKWVVLGYIIKAWNFYRNGVTISRIRYDYGGSKVEPFPVAI